MYGDIFSEWADQTEFDKIIDNASKESEAYEKLNTKFNEILLLHDTNPIDNQKIIDFLNSENQNGIEDKSYRESVLYFIITAVTNTNKKYYLSLKSQNDDENLKINTKEWRQDTENLASLFGFSNNHCYLLSLIYTLETELKDKTFSLFSQIDKDIFYHIIRDKDLLPSDSHDDENKKELIYYLMELLVKLGKYRDAYRFYNAFIDKKVQKAEVQVNIIETLTAETSLITSFDFFKKSGKDDLDKKLDAMIKMTIEKNKINEFIHLPFDSDEIQTIQTILKNKVEDKNREEEDENDKDKATKIKCYEVLYTLIQKVHL